jgi:uncharacterized protein (DUF697 family)
MSLGKGGSKALAPGTKAGDAEQLIRKYVRVALAVGLVPVPFVDLAALSAIQLQMVFRLSKDYQAEFSDELAKAVIASLLSTGGSHVAAQGSAKLLLKLVPGAGQVVCALSTSLFAGASTYAVGRVFVEHFESGGTILTFDPDKVRDFYTNELERGKTEIGQSFVGVRP